MRTTRRFLIALIAGAGAVAAVLTAPTAVAQPQPPLPKCVDTGGAEAIGGSTTECASPGNVQINSTPPEQEYVGPWGSMWEGDGFFFP
jgi:hypothetical protein